MEAIVIIISIVIIFIVIARKIPIARKDISSAMYGSLNGNGESGKKLNKFESGETNGSKKVKKVSKKTGKAKEEEKGGEVEINTLELLDKADTLIENRDLAGAEKILIDVISGNVESKNRAKVYNKLGIVYLEQENFADAKEAFKTALKYDKNNDLIYNNLGLALFNQGRYIEAIEAYQRSIQLNSLIPHRYINLGLSYAALRQYDKALDVYKKALVLDKNNKDYKKLVKEAQEKLEEISGSRA